MIVRRRSSDGRAGTPFCSSRNLRKPRITMSRAKACCSSVYPLCGSRKVRRFGYNRSSSTSRSSVICATAVSNAKSSASGSCFRISASSTGNGESFDVIPMTPQYSPDHEVYAGKKTNNSLSQDKLSPFWQEARPSRLCHRLYLDWLS